MKGGGRAAGRRSRAATLATFSCCLYLAQHGSRIAFGAVMEAAFSLQNFLIGALIWGRVRIREFRRGVVNNNDR